MPPTMKERCVSHGVGTVRGTEKPIPRPDNQREAFAMMQTKAGGMIKPLITFG